MKKRVLFLYCRIFPKNFHNIKELHRTLHCKIRTRTIKRRYKINKKILKKCMLLFCIIFTLNLLTSNNYAKYVLEYELEEKIAIDIVPPQPKFLITRIQNEKSMKHANKENTMVIDFVVAEKNFKDDNFNEKNLIFLVGGKEVYPESCVVVEEGQWQLAKLYQMTVFGIQGDGKLEVKAPKGIVRDIADNVNEEIIMDLNVTIDNSCPVVTYTIEKTENGTSMVTITANESIREIDGWNKINAYTLQKEFIENEKYNLNISDYVGNITEIEINITK